MLVWLVVLGVLMACEPFPSAAPAAGPGEIPAATAPAQAVAPTPTDAPPHPSPDRLVIAIPDAPAALDPFLVVSPSTLQIARNIYETLVEVDDHGDLRPGLARQWVGSEDARHWLFWLRPDAHFHDGRPVTGDDVAYSLERLKDPAFGNPRSREFALIDTIVLSETHLVGLHLSKPDATLPYRLAAEWAAIVPDESGDTLPEHPIGSGPYELAVWAPGQYVVLRRSAEYTAAVTAPSEIAFRTIVDDGERVQALRAGAVDLAMGVPLSAALEIESEPGFTVVHTPAGLVRTLALNHRRKPWDDARARQAVALAIDRATLVDEVWNGQAVPVGSELAPASPYFTNTLDASIHDPDRARALLAEAGITFTSGTSLSLAIPADEENRRLGEVVARHLREIGIPVDLQALDWIVFMNQVYFSHEFNAALTSHLAKADPLLAFTRYLTDSQWNYIGYEDAEYARLVDEASRSVESTRPQAFARLQSRLAKSAAVVYLASPLFSIAMKSSIRDCYVLPSGACDLRRLRKE